MNKLLKSFLGLGLVLLACGQLMAQKHDNNWLWGRQIRYQDSSQYKVGNAQADFSNGSFHSVAKFRNMPFADCAGFFSDENGNLQIYTNGMQIRDTTGNLIENGDSINFGQYWIENYPSMVAGDYALQFPRTVILLSLPDYDSLIYMIHEQPGDNTNNYDSRVKLTKIKRKADGSFKAIEKNKIITPTPPAFLNLAACKHGNGRDWWIFFTENNTNCICKFLLADDSLIDYGKQCIGDTIANKCGIKSTFSMQGSKYASAGSVKSGTNIFDFDRCSGLLSNPKYIPPILIYDSVFGNPHHISTLPWSIDFSPDANLLYIVTDFKVIQYDLNSPQFPNDGDTVGSTDNVIDTAVGGIFPFSFWSSMYGPDRVLYLSPGNNQRYLCTINNPNGKGALCDYRLKNVELPKLWSFTAPNVPNYRLGRLPGSACDTIYNDIKPIYTQAPWLKVFPNPANDEVQFDYNWIEWDRISDCELRISDLSGRVVLSQSIPKYSTRQSFSVKTLAAGTYLVSLCNSSKGLSSKSLATCKLVKQ